MEINPSSIRVRIFFRSQSTFWGKPQYYEKEIIFPSSTNFEEVNKVVSETYPKFLYFIYKGKAIKNPNAEQKK